MWADRIVVLFRLLLPTGLIYWGAHAVRLRLGPGWAFLVPVLVVVGVGLYQRATRQRGDEFENPAREEWIGGILLGAALVFVLLIAGGLTRLVF